MIQGAGDGEVIFDGDGAFRLFDVMAADYHIFEGLTIRNTEVAFWAGLKDVLGAKGLTVRNCRFENVGIGINAQYAGSTDFYIADNVFLGRDDPLSRARLGEPRHLRRASINGATTRSRSTARAT